MSIDFFGGADGVTVTCEIALSTAGGRYALWGASLWGRGIWGPGVVYQDLSDRIRGFGTSRKFDRTLDRWQSGTGWVLLDNRDGNLSPSNLSGTYVVAGASTIRPAIPIRLRVGYGGVTYGLIAGVVDDWQEEYIAAGPAAGDAAVRVSLVDDWAELTIDGQEVASVGAGESFGVRVHRILDAADHKGPRAIDPGEITCLATTLETTPVTELNLVAESEGGAIWPDANGVMRASGRYALINDPRSRTVQATFGDVDPTHLSYRDPKPTYDRTLICNQAVYTRVGGSPQQADDEASRSVYRLRRRTRTNLVCETDLQVAGLAQWHVAVFRQPRRRIEEITVDPRKDPSALWPVVCGLAERDLVRVIHHPPGGHTDDVYCHVSGISHNVQPGGQWETTYSLWSAEPYVTYATSRWGTAIWGRDKWFI